MCSYIYRALPTVRQSLFEMRAPSLRLEFERRARRMGDGMRGVELLRVAGAYRDA